MNPYPPPTNSQTFSTKPLSPAPAPTQVVGPQTGGGSPTSDGFGPLPPGQPIGQWGGNATILNGRLAINGTPMQDLTQIQRPTITDPNIDPSVRNSAIGDGFYGERGGFLYAGGQRLMPTTGSAAENAATLHQFGVRTPENAAAYNAAAAAPGGGGFGAPKPLNMGGLDALQAGGMQDTRGALDAMRAPSPMSSPWLPAGGASLPPLDTGSSTFGGGRNSVIEALMRQFRSRR